METLKRYAVEVIATIWLVLVAVQYLSRYFIPGLESVDLMPAYAGMLVITVAVVAVRVIKGVRKRSG